MRTKLRNDNSRIPVFFDNIVDIYILIGKVNSLQKM